VAVVVEAPFEVVGAVTPGSAGDTVDSAGDLLGWVADAVIPF